MADIHHKVQMNAAMSEVFRAITTREFFKTFAGHGTRVSVRTMDLEDGARIAWRCIDGPPEWIGTDITFDLHEEGDDRSKETILRFGHRNWREPSDFLAHCTTMWGRALLTLKKRLETPEPDDLLI